MKLTRLTSLLLTATTLATGIALSSCKNQTTNPDNPFAQGSANLPQNNNSNTPNTNHPNWAPGKVTGEKKLYGKTVRGDATIRFGDMFISLGDSCLLNYFSLDNPRGAEILCFDPLCLHLPQDEKCSAVINHYLPEYGDTARYPSTMYADEYENKESPVIYLFYRRDTMFTIDTQSAGRRDPVYCIERFDISKGYREIIMDNIENTILQMCNYGDYIYYVLDMGENEGQMLYRIHKSGGEPEQLDREEGALSLTIMDVVDDQLYYVVNSRYIYRCNLELNGSTKVLDMSDVKTNDGKSGVVAGSYCGYLYYFADVETVYSKPNQKGASIEKCNLYRLPMSDLTQTPERIVEGMIYSPDSYCFTDETLYYEPCVFQYVDESERVNPMVNYYTVVNTCDGKLYAMNLKTAESKLIVENSGMAIYPMYAWNDIVLFSGWAYKESGVENAGNNNNLLIAYASGEQFHYLCSAGGFGYVGGE